MRYMEKTGKVADARREVEAGMLLVTKFAECVLDGRNFDDDIRKLNHAKVDLARKERRLRELEKKMY